MSSASFRKKRFFGLGGVWRPPRDPKSLGGPRWREGTLSRSRAPARSSFYAFPFCAIEAHFSWSTSMAFIVQVPSWIGSRILGLFMTRFSIWFSFFSWSCHNEVSIFRLIFLFVHEFIDYSLHSFLGWRTTNRLANSGARSFQFCAFPLYAKKDHFWIGSVSCMSFALWIPYYMVLHRDRMLSVDSNGCSHRNWHSVESIVVSKCFPCIFLSCMRAM